MDERFKNYGKVSIRVIEECSELTRAICKAERFGYNNHHPDHPDLFNWMDIQSEIADVRRVIDEFEKSMQFKIGKS